MSEQNQKTKEEWLQELSAISSATAHEALGRIGAVDYEIKPICKGMKVCGPALTVKCHTGDNIMLHQALAIAKPGEVIIAHTGSCKQFGMWGEVMSVMAVARGVNAFVTDGGVRDTREIAELGLPVFSRSICINGTVKATVTDDINVPIEFGGVIVHPGDIILGDDDGIVVIPADRLEEAVTLSKQREAKEAIIMQLLREGKSTVELLGLKEKLGM